ncbi:nudix hydrolase 2-like [Populus alba x Populus x berolinensis]|uniref:Nudix hydrolase 2-like n=1 Tax=Populus alba x Populus x berolinensis TaxID=444605 RepID=A0AAD6LIA7_9ROSI|nr:nudix hydrolase 2-like [Populus alba x Populus x berolinensis]
MIRCFSPRSFLSSAVIFPLGRNTLHSSAVCKVHSVLVFGIWVRARIAVVASSMAVLACSKSGMEQVLVENEEVQQVKLLDSVNDDFGGVIVELSEAMDLKVFASMLKASIALWRSQGKRGVWIKVPIQLVNLVEAAVKEGFWFHHAEPKYLMLAFWIPEGSHTLPANASHRVTIGAFVMNKKREVLVVQEKYGIFRGTGIWKLPTGAVDEGEDIRAGAIREVKEETAIDTEFVEVLAFRQSHKSFFGKSDLIFVCMLRPLSFDIQKQESEIEDAQWMPWDDYVAQPFVQTHELSKQIVDICKAKEDETYFGFSPVPIASKLPDQKSYLYLNDRDLKGSEVRMSLTTQKYIF